MSRIAIDHLCKFRDGEPRTAHKAGTTVQACRHLVDQGLLEPAGEVDIDVTVAEYTKRGQKPAQQTPSKLPASWTERYMITAAGREKLKERETV